jgi:hypothetical protein
METAKTQITIKVRVSTHEDLARARRKFMVAKDIDLSLAEYTDRVIKAGIKAVN